MRTLQNFFELPFNKVFYSGEISFTDQYCLRMTSDNDPVDLTNISCIINVSDTPGLAYQKLPIPYFWFPIQESQKPWPYSAFYAVAKTYDSFKDKGDIVIHCHAGVCRSLITALALYLSEVDKSSLLSVDPLDSSLFLRHAPHNVVPFLQNRHAFPTYSVEGLVATIRKHD